MKKHLLTLLLLATSACIIKSQGQTTTRFNDGYLTVFKVTSASPLTNTGTAIVAEEYNTTTPAQTAPNYSVAIPTVTGNKLVVSGSATAAGGVSRSENGRYLLMPGYNGLIGDANTTFTTNAAIRTINGTGTVGAGISANGILWLAGNNNVRGAASDDGTNYWISGNGVGIQTSTTGNPITTVTTTSTNNRDVTIYNGQLYLTTGSSSQGIYSIGIGKPITSGTTSTRLFAPTNTDTYAFSISPDGYTIYYVASTAGGIYRCTLNGTVWTTGTQIVSGVGYTGIAVDWTNYTFSSTAANGARIFASNPSTIIVANDNGTTVATTMILRTEPAPTMNAFRQLAFSPSKQTISLGANTPLASTVSTASNDVVLFQFNLSADEGNATLKKLIINQQGTATLGAGNDISNFKLIEDANDNGIADPNELSAALAIGNVLSSSITFSSLILSSYINEGTSRNFIITGDVSPMASNNATFIPSIVSNKTLNGINYTTNAINAGNSWITIGATPPTGNPITISACSPVSVSTQPISPASICAGSATALFYTSVSGTAPFTYQWEENNVPISNNGIYSGTNTDTLKVINPSISLNGKTYRCVISNCSSINADTTDNTASLTVLPLAIQPAPFSDSSATVVAGQTSVVYTVPNDASILTYQWSYSGTGATINGIGNSITMSFSTIATSGTLSVVAIDYCGSSLARTLNITVNPLPGLMRITEYMYQGAGSGGAGEFVEFTNVGGASVDMMGWSFDDNTEVAGSQSLSAFGVVQPGESVILTEIPAATFRTNWNLCPQVKIIGGCTNNLGREDEINLYNASNNMVDRLTYGDQTYSPGSIRTTTKSGWTNAAGLGANTITNWTLSLNADAEASYASSLGEIGSPGKSTRAIVSFNPCNVPNGTPTIVMDVATTTNYLDGGITTAPVGSFGISGVINDPTDPATNLGIDFTINDDVTPVANLTVTTSSSNTAVVPNANIIMTGNNASRNIKITPASVGYSNITITVSDGTLSSSFVINYAASLASTTPTSTFWHTGMSDASDAVAIDDNYYMLGDDEMNIINVYSRSNSGLQFASFEYTSYLALPDPSKPEVDLEAGTKSPTNSNKVYWLGSMSNGKAPFDNKPNRNRIFATDYTGTGAATNFSFAGYYGDLRNNLIAWGDAQGYNFTASAAAGVDSKTDYGFSAEALAFAPDHTTLYIGLRAPLVPVSNRTKAVIAPITNFESWFNNGSPLGNPTFGAPLEIDLGGRSFRDLIVLSNGTYIIVAGNCASTPMTSALFKWTGNASDAPILLSSSADGILNMEGAMQVNTGGNISMSKLQVICDGGDEILYNDGSAAKDLANINLRKFRSDNLSSLDLCMPKSGDITAVACNSFSWYGTNYNTSQTPTHVFTTLSGCDSTVTLHLTINTSPALPVITQNGSILSSTLASSYQWYYNGTIINGATSSTYTTSANGSYYVVVTNASGCEATSNPFDVLTTNVEASNFENTVVAYPNPFSGNTSIYLTLANKSKVSVEVISLLGKHIQTLVNSDLDAGKHTFDFDAKQLGYSSGVYFVKLSINDKIITKKIMQTN